LLIWKRATSKTKIVSVLEWGEAGATNYLGHINLVSSSKKGKGLKDN